MEEATPFLGIVLVLFLGGLLLAAFVFWIWALIDAVKVPDDSMYQAGNKLVWVLIIVFTQFIGAVIYWFVGRPKQT
jgi:hypothetical protein